MLSAKIMEPECRCGCCCDLSEVPEPLSCLFGDDIILDTGVKKLFVTLGQFSIIRLERDIQLLMPAYDICMPAKDCSCSGGCCKQEDPCEMFSRFEFPVEEFFPKDGRGAPSDFDKDCGCRPKKDECRPLPQLNKPRQRAGKPERNFRLFCFVRRKTIAKMVHS